MLSLCSCLKLKNGRNIVRMSETLCNPTFLIVTETARRSKAILPSSLSGLTCPLCSRLWCSTLTCQHFDPLPVQWTAALRLSHYPQQDSLLHDLYLPFQPCGQYLWTALLHYWMGIAAVQSSQWAHRSSDCPLICWTAGFRGTAARVLFLNSVQGLELTSLSLDCVCYLPTRCLMLLTSGRKVNCMSWHFLTTTRCYFFFFLNVTSCT